MEKTLHSVRIMRSGLNVPNEDNVRPTVPVPMAGEVGN
jgi:hypothetical protein